MSSAPARIRRALARRGLRGTVERAWYFGSRRLVLRESHVWYALETAGERPRRELPDGVSIRTGTPADLALLESMDSVSPAEGATRLDGGHDLWLVLENGQLLFSCWIFRGRTPVAAAPGGWLSLPLGTVCLEDSETAPAARGRGIAPGAWTAIADSLAATGVARMVTKVGVENAPSRKAVTKAGFAEVALMHFQRMGPRRSTRVEVLEQERGAFFVPALRAAPA